ncbi:unnamed protein product [Rhizophagus irregularis]|nr:unnamed protein product [Rhizophagus irregularis]
MSLSLDKRYEIVFLHEHEAGPKWGYDKIASYIHCSKSAVVYWVKKYRENKDLTDEQKPGTEIQQKLEKQGVNVSSRTVRRRLGESGGKFVKETFKPLLSEKHRANRLKWAKKHKKFDWKQVIFTDESTFQLFQSNRKVWKFIGRPKVFRTVKHPQKVHVWGCFSFSGFDNDPKHRSKICKKWKEENEVTVLPWPSMSPNQNPIENVWQLMKIKISKKKIKTTKRLKAELTKEWNQLPVGLANNLVYSMEKRVMALINAGGDYTMY